MKKFLLGLLIVCMFAAPAISRLPGTPPTGGGGVSLGAYDSAGDGHIDAAAGGTNIDTSASTGIATVTGGVWSIAQVIDNVIIGGGIPAPGYFTTLGVTGSTSIQGQFTFNDDIKEYFGATTGTRFGLYRDSSTGRFLISTEQTGASMNDTDAIITFRVNSAGGTLDPGQRLFAILSYLTNYMYLNADGTLWVLGEINAGGFGSTVQDGYHYGNLMNTNGELFTEAAGDFYWDNTTKLWQTYDGSGWRYGQYDAIEFVIDGGGSVISTGQKGHIEVPYPCKVVAARMFADQTGSIIVDIWKDSYANFPPDNGDSITSATPPTISSAQLSQDTTLNGWTTSLAAGDIIAYNVDSASTVTRVTVSLKVLK